MNPRVQQLDSILPNLPQYMDRNRVKRDCLELLHNVPSLDVQINSFFQNNGQTSTWLQIFGLLPIHYKGAQYNIPIHLWITEIYPNSAPICYVAPTPNMRIKKNHSIVNMQGLITTDSLKQWFPNQSNLINIVMEFTDRFSREPPVVSNVGGHSSSRMRQSFSDYPKMPDEPKHNRSSSSDHNALSKSAAEISISPVSEAAQRKEKLTSDITKKIQSRMREYNKNVRKDIDELFESQSKVQANSARLQRHIERLKKEKEDLKSLGILISKKTKELEIWLKENKSIDISSIDPEELVSPVDMWSKQMIETVAQDTTIEDTLYALDRALEDDRINLADYLKHARKLTRDQFFAREIINKVSSSQSNLHHSIK